MQGTSCNLQMLKINMNRAVPIMLIVLASYLLAILSRNSFKFYLKLFLISHVNDDSSLRNKEHIATHAHLFYV